MQGFKSLHLSTDCTGPWDFNPANSAHPVPGHLHTVHRTAGSDSSKLLCLLPYITAWSAVFCQFLHNFFSFFSPQLILIHLIFFSLPNPLLEVSAEGNQKRGNVADQFSSYIFLLTALCKSRRDKGILLAPLPREKNNNNNAAAFNLLPDHLKQLFNCLLPASPFFPLKAFSIISTQHLQEMCRWHLCFLCPAQHT